MTPELQRRPGLAQNDDMDTPIAPGVRVGHVHLKVAQLDRALAFYHGVLGLAVTQRLGGHAAFLAAGGYHHHLALNTWESRGGAPPPPGATPRAVKQRSAGLGPRAPKPA